MRILLIFIFLCSAVIGEQLSKEQALAALKPYADEFIELLQQNKHMEALKFYDEDIIDMVPFRPPIRGLDELRRVTRKAVAAGLQYHSASGNVEDAWGCDDMIYERGTLAFSQTTRDNPKPEAYYGSYFTIWKKQADGSYKMRYTIWNLDFNPWE